MKPIYSKDALIPHPVLLYLFFGVALPVREAPVLHAAQYPVFRELFKPFIKNFLLDMSMNHQLLYPQLPI